MSTFNSPTTAVKAPDNTAGGTKLTSSSVRGGLIIQNVGAVDVWIGPSGVTTSSTNRGYLLKGGQTPPAEFVDRTGSSDWYGITASVAADLTVITMPIVSYTATG